MTQSRCSVNGSHNCCPLVSVAVVIGGVISFPTLPVSIRAGHPGVLLSLCEKSGTDFVPISPRAISLGMNYYLFLKIRLRRLILPRESTDNIYLPGVLQTGNCKLSIIRCRSNVMESLRSERGPLTHVWDMSF